MLSCKHSCHTWPSIGITLIRMHKGGITLKLKNKFLVLIIAIIFCLNSCIAVFAETTTDIDITSKSALLMEATTGKVLYEKNSHEKLLPASVTKVMTLLLIMESLDSGKIKLTDKVNVSEYAASMGGSQVYLEPGEQMSVNDMLKAIAVASGNDATVAMAEFVAGSEQAFVRLMNDKAKILGMNDTVFYNTTGLDDEEPCNLTSAYDIAVMSRELLKHQKIFDYTTIWIDSLRDGKFGLANTNKLIRFYQGANGLKTGSTGKALFSLAASAKRDGLQLISTIMCGPTSQDRFNDAKKLLNYGFANYKCIAIAKKGDVIKTVTVYKGLYQQINAIAGSDINVLVNKGEEANIVPEVIINPNLAAPFKKGDKIGEIVYKVNNKEVGKFDLISEKDVSKINVFNAFLRVMSAWVNS